MLLVSCVKLFGVEFMSLLILQVYMTHNIPGERAGVYRRRRHGPPYHHMI
jgi:hypothetical protein